jgi:branched-chain amino acid transport system substrate-binding protein
VWPFKVAVAAAVLAAMMSATPPAVASGGVVKIGVLDDMSGVYADLAGKGSVLAARMAIDDFGGKVLGLPVELVSADHQNKADIGAEIARHWFDVDKVDVIVDMLNSAVALAVEQVAKEKDRVVIATSVGTPAFTGKACMPTALLWTQDAYAITHSVVGALNKQGLNTWYFVAVDYSFGHALVHDATAAIEATGGKVIGAVYHPLNEHDFSSVLLRAQASGAKVIALANAGHDMTTAVKQAAEFGITKSGQKLAALVVYNTNLHSLGLKAAQGLIFSSPFDIGRNEASRAWSKRFFDKNGTMPTLAQASVYSAVTHYLQAIASAKSVEAKTVVAAMRKAPVNDFYASDAHIRADGVLVHDMYLMRAKRPDESKGPWDLAARLAVIPGEQAFMPLAKSECPLVAHR